MATTFSFYQSYLVWMLKWIMFRSWEWRRRIWQIWWLVVRCSMYLPVFQPISNHATLSFSALPEMYLLCIWDTPFTFPSYLSCSTFPFRILINHQFTHPLSTLHLIYMYLSSYMYLSDILSSYMYLFCFVSKLWVILFGLLLFFVDTISWSQNIFHPFLFSTPFRGFTKNIANIIFVIDFVLI